MKILRQLLTKLLNKIEPEEEYIEEKCDCKGCCGEGNCVTEEKEEELVESIKNVYGEFLGEFNINVAIFEKMTQLALLSKDKVLYSTYIKNTKETENGKKEGV